MSWGLLRWLSVVKELAARGDDLSLIPQNPHGRRRELSLTSCPLTSTWMQWHMQAVAVLAPTPPKHITLAYK